jgi:hypothetical protein
MSNQMQINLVHLTPDHALAADYIARWRQTLAPVQLPTAALYLVHD